MIVFHLAIPTHDLNLAQDFYVNNMHGILARRYDDRVTFRFYDHQIVCHLAPDEIEKEIKMYPRHFGITFSNKHEFDELYYCCKKSKYPLYQDLFIRWPEKEEQHQTFFIADPSNNLLEFKYYSDPKFIY